MVSFSLCMIVKNEEEVLRRCLQSTKNLFDEIIIVDTGSTDKTKEIAKEFTDKVYDFTWQDDFALARNYSLSFASCDFVMWLDADDVITSKNLKKLLKLKQRLTLNTDVVMLKYAISFENNKSTFSFFRERIFNRLKNFQFEGFVHEVVSPFGNILYEDIEIEHRKIKANSPKRNLKIYEKHIKNGEVLSPRHKFYYARELYFNGIFTKSIKVFKDFLKEKYSFIENKIEACLMLSKCYLEKGDFESGLKILMQSFIYDVPRAEICCEIGYIFRLCKNFSKAIYWYEVALKIKPNYTSGAFIQEDCYNFIPHIELCVCYYYLGDYNKAYYHNLKAKNFKPNHESVLNNDKFLKKFITK